jgi:DNA-binding MarR family transcriptional regulator
MKQQAQPSPVSPLDAHLGFWMRFVSNQVSAEFERAVEARGVSLSEWVALRSLYDQAGTTHAALMASLGMTKGAVSKVVSRLQDKGHVTRTSHRADARAQVLALTCAGRALVPALARDADANDERFFGHLSAKQRQALMALLRQMVQLHQFAQVPVA